MGIRNGTETFPVSGGESETNSTTGPSGMAEHLVARVEILDLSPSDASELRIESEADVVVCFGGWVAITLITLL